MTKMTLSYMGSLRTELTHINSGKKIITDAPKDNHGKGEAFSPTDLTAASLASCIITVMGIKAQSWKKDLGKTTAEIEKTMTSNPRRIHKISVEVSFSKQSFTDKEIEVLKEIGLNCPVAKSLHPGIHQEIKFNLT